MERHRQLVQHPLLHDLVSSHVRVELVAPLESFGASWTDLQAANSVLDHICQNRELQLTPRTGTLDGLRAGTVHEPHVTPQIGSIPELMRKLYKVQFLIKLKIPYLKAMLQGRQANLPGCSRLSPAVRYITTSG